MSSLHRKLQSSRLASASTRLPDGSDFSPVWTALDDHKLAQGMIMKQPDFGSHLGGLTRPEVVLNIPGLFTPLGEVRVQPSDQAQDIIETVAQFMCSHNR